MNPVNCSDRNVRAKKFACGLITAVAIMVGHQYLGGDAMASPESEKAKNVEAKKERSVRDKAFEYRDKKQYKKAEAAFRELLPLTPENHHRISIMMQIASAVDLQGRNADAEKEYLAAISEAQKNQWFEDVRSSRCFYAEFLNKIERKNDALALKAMLEDKHCPVCKSDQHVQRITYGLVRKPVPGAAYGSGGCQIVKSGTLDLQISPVWHCDTCKISF